ncbi:MAG: DUF501 domain-containing protein [Synergistes sp.]|nr:DUF501 domain-containing protein [Synergistes sp.]
MAPLQNRPTEFRFTAFWDDLKDEDKIVLKKQMKGRKFNLDSVLAAARRCKYGFPQVIVSSPVSSAGTPFPTIFWLTCPFLDHRCGELESEQKISELEKIFAEIPESVEKMHREYAELRMSLIEGEDRCKFSNMSEGMRSAVKECGVGGIDSKAAPNAVKCLHLQTATWLGMRKHPAQEWLEWEIGDLECDCACCEYRSSEAKI